MSSRVEELADEDRRRRAEDVVRDVLSLQGVLRIFVIGPARTIGILPYPMTSTVFVLDDDELETRLEVHAIPTTSWANSNDLIVDNCDTARAA
ncbi:Uncharacterized protein PBTT_02704 [Plasmodiophora brassicae]